MRADVVLLIGLTLASTAALAQDRRHIVMSPQNKLPFSDGMVVGDTLYIGGQLGLDPQTGKPPSDAEEEARLVMDAVKRVLQEAGMSMDDLVMIQVHCPDLSLYPTFNKVYRTYFEERFPARAFLGSGKLLRDARFEVLGMAVKRK